MTPLPSRLWENIKVDFFGPLPSSDYLLIMTDSKWTEAEILKSTSPLTTIPLLDKTFATYGIPYQITTDNGPEVGVTSI